MREKSGPGSGFEDVHELLEEPVEEQVGFAIP
jgi:hypothetical protein